VVNDTTGRFTPMNSSFAHWRRVGGFEGLPGQVLAKGKLLTPPWIELRTVQPVEGRSVDYVSTWYVPQVSYYGLRETNVFHVDGLWELTLACSAENLVRITYVVRMACGSVPKIGRPPPILILQSHLPEICTCDVIALELMDTKFLYNVGVANSYK
jgi:hypothetical protein